MNRLWYLILGAYVTAYVALAPYAAYARWGGGGDR